MYIRGITISETPKMLEPKPTIYWSPLLHIYQPPWQDVEVLKRINSECYVPLLSMIERHDNAKITLNVQGCLLDMLHEHGMDQTIELMKTLIQLGKLS